MTASWLLGFLAASSPPPVPCSVLYRKCGGGREGGRTVRAGGRERWEAEVCLNQEACAVKLCTTPCGAACVEREIIFPAKRNSPT